MVGHVSTFFVKSLTSKEKDLDILSIDISPDLAREIIAKLEEGLRNSKFGPDEYTISFRVYLSGELIVGA